MSALSADGLRAHKLGRWAEAYTVVSAGVNVWAFDVDVVLPPQATPMSPL